MSDRIDQGAGNRLGKAGTAPPRAASVPPVQLIVASGPARLSKENVVIALSLLVALLIVDQIPIKPGHTGLIRRVGIMIAQMHNGSLNADDYHAMAANYYEGIEQFDRISQDNVENADYHLRPDFLRYENNPHINRPYAAGMRTFNSFGMQNPEYPLLKPPHIRRIAVLGDSISLGPAGHDYVTLLEDKLNQVALTPGKTDGFQLLSFAVSGYVLLQEMDVALEKVSKFQPDVYVVALTSREIDGSRKHLAKLVVRGTDLKYEYLRQVVRQAGVKPTDHVNTIVLKLGPYFQSMTTWALEQIKKHAEAEGAQMIVVLLAAPFEYSVTVQDFDVLHQSVDGLGVPVIDLREAFHGVNLPDVEVAPGSDIHPNALGHKMIFDTLYSRLQAQPEAWHVLAGDDAPVPDGTPRR